MAAPQGAKAFDAFAKVVRKFISEGEYTEAIKAAEKSGDKALIKEANNASYKKSAKVFEAKNAGKDDPMMSNKSRNIELNSDLASAVKTADDAATQRMTPAITGFSQNLPSSSSSAIAQPAKVSSTFDGTPMSKEGQFQLPDTINNIFPARPPAPDTGTKSTAPANMVELPKEIPAGVGKTGIALAGAGALAATSGDTEKTKEKNPPDFKVSMNPDDDPGKEDPGEVVPDNYSMKGEADKKAKEEADKKASDDDDEKKRIETEKASIYKPVGINFDEFAEKRQKASDNFDSALLGIRERAKESEGAEKEKYEKLSNSLNLVRDKIDAFDSNERKMLAWERVGDMLARSLGQLGAGLAGVYKPLELQAGDQTARYADLQALGRQQRESLGQERSIGEKSYSERMRDIGKDATEQRDASTRKYTTESASIDREMESKRRAADDANQAAITNYNRQLSKQDREDAKTQQGLFASQKLYHDTQTKKIGDSQRQLGLLEKRNAALVDIENKLLTNPKAATAAIKNAQALDPQGPWSIFNTDGIDSKEGLAAATKSIANLKTPIESQIATLNNDISTYSGVRDAISAMTPQQWNEYRASISSGNPPPTMPTASNKVGQGPNTAVKMQTKDGTIYMVSPDNVRGSEARGWKVINE